MPKDSADLYRNLGAEFRFNRTSCMCGQKKQTCWTIKTAFVFQYIYSQTVQHFDVIRYGLNPLGYAVRLLSVDAKGRSTFVSKHLRCVDSNFSTGKGGTITFWFGHGQPGCPGISLNSTSVYAFQLFIHITLLSTTAQVLPLSPFFSFCSVFFTLNSPFAPRKCKKRNRKVIEGP